MDTGVGSGFIATTDAPSGSNSASDNSDLFFKLAN